jgi:hypothetical protein
MAERDIKVVFTLEGEQAKRSLTELNQGLELLKKGFSVLKQVGAEAIEVIEKGDKIEKASAAFDSLYGATQRLAGREGLQSLRAALNGTVSDLDIFTKANRAAAAGIKPEDFLLAAEAAEKLGGAYGISAKDGLDQLTVALAKGNDKIIQSIGLNIDNTKAIEDYRVATGKLKGTLTETERAEANRVAIIAKIKEQLRDLPKEQTSVADGWTRVTIGVDNLIGVLGRLLNSSPALQKFLDDFARGLGVIADNLISTREEILKTNLAEIDAQLKGLGRAGNAPVTRDESGNVTGVNLRGQLSRVQILEKTLDLTAKRAAIEKALAEIIEKRTEIEVKGGTEGNRLSIEQQEALEKQLTTIQQIQRELAAEGIGRSLQKAIDDVNEADFQQFFNQYKESLTTATKEALRIQNPDVADALLDETAALAVKSKFEDIAKSFEEAQKKAFENSVSLFEDLFQNAIDGTTFNLEDALKRVAVGFAAQIAASFVNIGGSSITSASGLGQAIAAQLGFGQAAGGSAIGGVLGSNFGGIFAGSGVAGVSGSLAGGAGVAAGGILGYLQLQGLQQAISGNKPNTAQSLALAPLTGGFSLLGLGGLFGSKGDPERLAREGLFGGENGLPTSFRGVRGNINIDPSQYNVGGGLAGESVGLVQGLADVVSGGNDKLGDDLAGIFANAVSEANNFNEAMVNTLSLMDEIGINAEDAKNELTRLFLDGQVSLEEFGAGLESFNVLAQENLVGTGSVSDALSILAENIDANPAAALKAFELLLKEASEIGINSMGDLGAYLSDSLSPQARVAFEAIASQGINSFEDLQSASSDQIFFIFSQLSTIRDILIDTFVNAASNAADSFDSSAEKINSKLGKINNSAKETLGTIENLNRAGVSTPSGGGGRNPNSSLGLPA